MGRLWCNLLFELVVKPRIKEIPNFFKSTRKKTHMPSWNVSLGVRGGGEGGEENKENTREKERKRGRAKQVESKNDS